MNSERVDRLDWGAEVFYRRLMSKVDDFGLYDARPSILRASLYPLRIDKVSESDILGWISQCEVAKLILIYKVDSKPFLKMLDTKWKTRSEAKHPPPPDANGRLQLQTDALLDVYEGVVVVGDGVGRQRPAPRAVLNGAAFESFWKAYPNKKAKGSAERAWEKIKVDRPLFDRIMAAIERAKRSEQWTKDGGQFIPHPATWLNQKRWDDEVGSPARKGAAW